MAVQVKVCGVRDVASLQRCVTLGVDWVGFNFVPDSHRWIDPDFARQLIESLPPDGPTPVGVFRDQAPNNVMRVARKTGVKVIQLHGSEPVAYCAALGGPFDLWKALVGESVTLSDFEAFAAVVDGFVIDGRVGGSGAEWSYGDAAPLFGKYEGLPVLLAGGLNDVNVEPAIRVAGAFAVDVASGVEESKTMTPERVERFVRAARGAGP